MEQEYWANPTYYIGMLENANGPFRIMPYQNHIIILFDNRILIFQPDGSWEKIITFPRGNPDGIYVTTSKGEGSFAIDEAADEIYLIQGFQIISVNQQTGKENILYRKENADFSSMAFFDGKLFFTVHPYDPSMFDTKFLSNSPTDLIRYDLLTKETEILKMDRNTIIDSLQTDKSPHLNLWYYDNPDLSKLTGWSTHLPLDEFHPN